MDRFVYGYSLDVEDGEVVFRFPKIDRIISALPAGQVSGMTADAIEDHAHDAVIEALQTYVAGREELPLVDDERVMRADGFVRLTPQEAMKLELYKLYRENCKTVTEFAARIERSATVARRLLDLRYRSAPKEIESSVNAFGKQLVHSWALEAAGKPTGVPQAVLEPC
jgi:hypothetical protein